MPIWSPGRHIPTQKIPKCPPPGALTNLTEKACKVITVASDGKVAFIHDITPNREEKKCLQPGVMFMLKDLHYEPLVKIVSESIFFHE